MVDPLESARSLPSSAGFLYDRVSQRLVSQVGNQHFSRQRRIWTLAFCYPLPQAHLPTSKPTRRDATRIIFLVPPLLNSTQPDVHSMAVSNGYRADNQTASHTLSGFRTSQVNASKACLKAGDIAAMKKQHI